MGAIGSLWQKQKEKQKDNYVFREIVDLTVQEFQKRKAKKKNTRARAFHPSQIGKCARAQIYSYFSNELKFFPKINTTQGFMIFENGHFMHDRYNKWFKKAADYGIITDLRLNVKLRDVNSKFCDKFNVEGEWDLDFVYKGVWYIGDFKSMRWEMFMKAERKKSELYLDQLHLYFLAAKFKGIGTLMYECKNDQKMDEVMVPFDIVRAQNIKNKLNYLKNCVKGKTLPPRICDNKKDACKQWCDFAEVCWVINNLDEVKK